MTAVLVGCLAVGTAKADDGTVRQDTLFNVDKTVEWVYKNIIPQLDRVKFTGGGQISSELTSRWNDVLNHLNSRKSTMADDVRKLLVSPSGKPIDLDLIKKIVNIEKVDSSYSIQINPEYLLNELMISADNVKDAAKKMAEQNK